MKRILALTLTMAMIFTSFMCISIPFSAKARETSEILSNIGNFKEVLATVNLGDGNFSQNASFPSGLVKGAKRGTGTFSFNSVGTAKNVTDSATGKTYTAYTNTKSTVNVSALNNTIYPGIENAGTDKLLKLTQTANAGALRFKNIFNGNLGLVAGDQITVTMKVYLADIKAHSAGVNSDGSAFSEVSDTTSKTMDMSYRLISGTDEGTFSKRMNIPVNVWYTLSYMVNVTSDNLDVVNKIDGVRLSCVRSSDALDAYTTSYAASIFVENVTLSKFVDTSATHLDNVNYTEDFEDIDFNMEYSNNGYRYVSRSENYRFNEDKITVNTMLSANVGAGNVGTYTVDGTAYKYTYSSAAVLKNASGTRNGGNNRGRVQVWGTVSNTTMGVTSAAMFADSTVAHKTASPGAADFVKNSSASGVQTINTKAHSGTKSIAVTSRCYWGTGFKYGNLFGFNPTSIDSGRKFKIKFYIYPDSTRGGYKSSTGFSAPADVTKANAVDASSITPRIKVQMTSGPSQYYKYRNSSAALINVANPTLEWDKWNEVSFEWTIGDCYDNGDNSVKTGNPLVNVLTITDYATTDVIDTFYFDDLTVEEIIEEDLTDAPVDQYGYKKASVVEMESHSNLSKKNTWVNIGGTADNTSKIVNKAYDESFSAPQGEGYDFGSYAVGVDYSTYLTESNRALASGIGARLVGSTSTELKDNVKYKMSAWIYPSNPTVSTDTYCKIIFKPATTGQNPGTDYGRPRYLPLNEWSKIEIVFTNTSAHCPAGTQPGTRFDLSSTNSGTPLTVYFEDFIFEEYVGIDSVPYGLNRVQDFEEMPALTDASPATSNLTNYNNSLKPYYHMYNYYKTGYPTTYENAAYAPVARAFGTGVTTVNYSYSHTRSGIVSSKIVKSSSLAKGDLGGALYANIFGTEFTADDIGRTFQVTAYVYIDRDDVYTGAFGSEAGYGTDFNQKGTYFSIGLGGLDAYTLNSSSIVSFAKADAAIEATHRNCTYNLKTGFVPYGEWTPVTTYYTVTEDTIYNSGDAKSNAINAIRISQTNVDNICTSDVPVMGTFYVDDITALEVGSQVEFSGSNDNGTYSASATIKNTLSEEYISAMLIIAAYDVNGEFITMTVSDEVVFFNNESDFPLELNLEMDEVGGGVDYYAFLWSDLEAPYPYTKMIKLN